MIDASFWINTIAGFVVGILSSIIFWWAFSHALVPNIQYEDFISKVETTETESGFKYRLAFRNLGRRGIIDVELFARLSIKGLNPEYPSNLTFFSIPTGYARLPKMEPKKSCYRHITRLKVHEIEELRDSQFSVVISKKLEENLEICQALKAQRIDAKDFERNPQLLEHLMKLGIEATLQVFMFSYDEFSGARKLFGPKVYAITDIKRGKFPNLSC